MATPTITPLPIPPSRQNSAGTFATLADNFMSALPPFADQMNRALDFVDQRAEAADEAAENMVALGDEQVQAATQKANAAGVSAQAAATQATNSKAQAEASKGYRDTAQAAAAAAQAAAGLPAMAGKGGLPLVPKRDGSGVEYSSSLRRYELDLNQATAVLDLSTGQVFKVDATVARTLSFTNPPSSNRSTTVVLHITGAEPIIWPASILWNGSRIPVLGNAWTTVILIWIGDGWVGSVGARS